MDIIEFQPRRIERIRQVAQSRLGGLTAVLENVRDPHNVSAVLRSAEGFGLRTVHVICPEGKPELSKRVTQGCHKWLDIRYYSDSATCLQQLRGDGFRLYAAEPEGGSRDLRDMEFTRPTALVFGSEHDGLSDEARALCDESFVISMCGFSQSFNVSVAVAISIFWGAQKRREVVGKPSDLSEIEIAQIERAWLRMEMDRRHGRAKPPQ